ncbi:Piso0_004884 [Millerozyma farinosa CBS 7064]|uniref:Piso0_004884 protein n=1 Tax=Pichia sorbitophila (strain ATCC MYA-4447 / BCRC 22081 / CBS 7064 / NBRC 10061 / NRRL Y-12695) TaxID=559304 RepID=G8Y3N0_PICSO|nr:Piso0_004884 [Millerozyma farinosa CBS 7064]
MLFRARVYSLMPCRAAQLPRWTPSSSTCLLNSPPLFHNTTAKHSITSPGYRQASSAPGDPTRTHAIQPFSSSPRAMFIFLMQLATKSRPSCLQRIPDERKR